MSTAANPPDAAERAAIAAAGLEATFAAYPGDVLEALRNATALRARLVRSNDPAQEPATVYRPRVTP